ncbi:aminotransferase-like domain-containing protein [Microvirga sp. 2YAF29]|uniref:aminotransferase-like domain-containing protein n=1 Tax=Microvirga sp. 2YAF29 TaxID=3233031 RepID=UPI003F9A60F2
MDDASIGQRSETQIERVMRGIRNQIASRLLAQGAKLPSIRSTAEAMQVSKSTVVEAYDRLMAEGIIRSKPGSGFYSAAPHSPVSLADIAPRLDRSIDPFWVSRQSLEAGGSMLKPGCGWLPSHWMPTEEIRRSLRSLSRMKDPVGLTDYGSPLGLPALRQYLSRRMMEQGFAAAPDQILLTDSGTQAIDLVCRLLLRPGDTVLVDDPCYFNFLALLRAHQVKVVGVPYTPTGPDIGLFEEALSAHRPRLYITNSGIHNPTGATLSAVTAHKLLKLAEAHELLIVEDDILADFEIDPAPRLAALDGLSRVVRVGSFSKTLSASFRCGYIAARPDWIDKLIDHRIATGFSSNRLSEELALSVLSSGAYHKHKEALRVRLAKARASVVPRLRALGIEPWLVPKAGMLLWCRLPDGVDGAEVARLALADGAVLAPGNVFSPSQTMAGFLRFNVAQCEDRVFPIIEKAIRLSCGA